MSKKLRQNAMSKNVSCQWSPTREGSPGDLSQTDMTEIYPLTQHSNINVNVYIYCDETTF